MKELTKAEEQIMHILWNIKSGFVKDIRAQMREPKPAYTTVSTIVRTLEEKKFVGYEAYGKTHKYFPVVNKSDYTKVLMKDIMGKYFGNSLRQMVSFFSNEKGLTTSELEELKFFIDEEIKNQE
jgi:BlaI family transcriptional regulator, penicillinase repressor